MAFDLGDYVDVAERIALFREKHPEGSLRPADPKEPYRLQEVGSALFVVYVAAAYRTPDDKRPGIGVAWEPMPGKTPYTKDSELQNAETSAWGRAIVASLAADTRAAGVASRDEVRNRRGRDEPAGYEGPPLASDADVTVFLQMVKASADVVRQEMNLWWGEHRPEGQPTEAWLEEAHQQYAAVKAANADPVVPETAAAPATASDPPSGPETPPSEPPPPADRYEGFRKDDLKGACEARSLATTGTVEELRARLDEFDARPGILPMDCEIEGCPKAASMLFGDEAHPYCPDHEPL